MAEADNVSSGTALKLLLDTNVWDCRTTHEYVEVQKTVQWGNSARVVRLTQPRHRLIRATEDESLRIFQELRRIGDLARVGEVTLYRSMEIAFEGMYRPIQSGALEEHDVFCRVRARTIHAPVLRDFVFTPRKSQANEEKLAFLEALTAPRYLELRKRIAGRHLVDLFHLWTAEHHGLDYFITLDQKFVNAVTLPTPLITPVRVCTPSRFLQHREG